MKASNSRVRSDITRRGARLEIEMGIEAAMSIISRVRRGRPDSMAEIDGKVYRNGVRLVRGNSSTSPVAIDFLDPISITDTYLDKL